MISPIIQKMISLSEGSLYDINHFIKVWTYSKTIAELEGVDTETQSTLEIAAVVHDIACPSLRRRYGEANGKKQEVEGPPLAKEFLAEFDLPQAQLDRVLYLVGHHHSPGQIDGIDYQILIEADYIVNAGEKSLSRENILHTRETIFKTVSGKAILSDVFQL